MTDSHAKIKVHKLEITKCVLITLEDHEQTKTTTVHQS